MTGRAKTAIRRALREADRERYIKLGRELARVAFENIGKKCTDKVLRTAAKTLAIEDPEELLARLGSAEITSGKVVRAVYPELAERTGDEIEKARAVVGLSGDQSYTRAQCCQAVPGERIVGIATKGQGVIVHTIDCEALISLEEETDRWVDIHWQDGRHAADHNVTFDMTITNDAGVLGRICTVIGEQQANISDMTFVDRKPDFYRLSIDIQLRDIEHLHRVMTALEAESNVSSISRQRDPSRLKPSAQETVH